jgi:predicted metal-dependent hydrolase
VSTLAPIARHSFATSSSARSFTSQSTSDALARANASAVSFPIPLAAPVTSAVFPETEAIDASIETVAFEHWVAAASGQAAPGNDSCPLAAIIKTIMFSRMEETPMADVVHREAAERPLIKARKMEFPFASAGIPRHWLGNSVLGTCMVNGLNLVFPEGERFFVRSVRAYASLIEKDPVLAAEVRGFMGQESRHGIEHERFFEVLAAQGYDIDRFMRVFKWLIHDVFEPRMSAKFRLAVTAAMEHFTATFAEKMFKTGILDEHAHPMMRDLFTWHGAEEIEHKAVAYEVLQRVDPSYTLRASALVFSAVSLAILWSGGAVMLLRQEKGLSFSRLRRERKEARRRGQLGIKSIFLACAEYLRPDFHPAKNDNRWMADAYFEKLSRAAA